MTRYGNGVQGNRFLPEKKGSPVKSAERGHTRLDKADLASHTIGHIPPASVCPARGQLGIAQARLPAYDQGVQKNKSSWKKWAYRADICLISQALFF